jgi:hypothetical protein
MKSLFVARSGGSSFRLYTKSPNGRHAEVDYGTGTLLGSGKVSVKVGGETLQYDTPVEAISAATKEGFAVVG